MHPYPGPLRDEPLSIELHNTRYADAGALVDGLGDATLSGAWLAGIAARLPVGGSGADPSRDGLMALREPIREALHEVLEGRNPACETLEAINVFSRRSPGAHVARWQRGAGPVLALDFGRATRSDVVLGALAADAVDLLTGPARDEIRACGAPGCILAFLRSHPRRAWCSGACGNRARQARHYARTRAG
jgi:predicted RNA-binding Zn ribbon-like protein